MIIYKNKYLRIIFQNNKYFFEINDDKDNKILINTFLNIPEDGYNKKIIILAEDINTLEHFLKKKISIKMCKLIFLFLIKQLKHLEDNNLTILNYSIKDIIYFKINGEYSFYFLNNKAIFSFDKNKKILINKLFIKNDFLSPEIHNIKEIPNNSILITASYWSLAKIMEYCLKTVNKDLEDIKYTKLYWALHRCLKVNPKHRYLLFI